MGHLLLEWMPQRIKLCFFNFHVLPSCALYDVISTSAQSGPGFRYNLVLDLGANPDSRVVLFEKNCSWKEM